MLTLRPLRHLYVRDIDVSGIYKEYSQPWKHCWYSPDNKVHGANMVPIWGRQDPGGPHVGPMNFAIWVLVTRLAAYIRAASALLYRQVSLNWHTKICMGRFIIAWFKSNLLICFLCIWKLECPKRKSLKYYCILNTAPYWFHAWEQEICPQTLVGVCQNRGVCGVVTSVATREIFHGLAL